MARLEESESEPASLNILREANLSLHAYLARNPGVTEDGEEEVRAMLQIERTLRAAGGELDRLRAIDGDQVRLELALYRNHLLQLRQQLDVKHQSAIERQARLFVREKHLRAAQSWCASARSSS